MRGSFTRRSLRALDWLAARFNRKPEALPAHQLTGRRGEEDAYFYLRRKGYMMVARNYRTPRRRGEIDLIGWDKGVLCFIEVKTRTSREVKPAEAAVDHAKRRKLGGVAQEFMRHLPLPCSWRFDVVSVYYDRDASHADFELFQNAFSVS